MAEAGPVWPSQLKNNELQMEGKGLHYLRGVRYIKEARDTQHPLCTHVHLHIQACTWTHTFTIHTQQRERQRQREGDRGRGRRSQREEGERESEGGGRLQIYSRSHIGTEQKAAKEGELEAKHRQGLTLLLWLM